MMRLASRGFTLIELLVVIAIIGLLSSVLVASLNESRAKARDSKRLADLRQIQTALETYRNDNGAYPSTGGSAAYQGITGCTSYTQGGNTGATGWIPNLSPTYIAVLPSDPKPNFPNYCYVYTSNGTDYMLIALGTVETRLGANNPARLPKSPTSPSFAFYTPGARLW